MSKKLSSEELAHQLKINTIARDAMKRCDSIDEVKEVIAVMQQVDNEWITRIPIRTVHTRVLGIIAPELKGIATEDNQLCIKKRVWKLRVTRAINRRKGSRNGSLCSIKDSWGYPIQINQLEPGEPFVLCVVYCDAYAIWFLDRTAIGKLKLTHHRANLMQTHVTVGELAKITSENDRTVIKRSGKWR